MDLGGAGQARHRKDMTQLGDTPILRSPGQGLMLHAVCWSMMVERNPEEQSEVDRFIMDRIDSVPHLEALLLMRRDGAQASFAEKLAKQLWVKPDFAKTILQDLARDGFLDAGPTSGEYFYRTDPDTDRLVGLLNETYQRELIRVSTMIHSKPAAAVREFARAFRLKRGE